VIENKCLDDRSFEQILQSAMNRLPTLCPNWTDYNLHDPGVTLIELFAWYQEMQRYHLDQLTEPIRRRILHFLGGKPRGAQSARCHIDLTGAEGAWVKGACLMTEDNIPFEVVHTMTAGEVVLERCLLENGEHTVDITDLLGHKEALLNPFTSAGAEELVLRFSKVDAEQIRLWFEVAEDVSCPRNPFEDPDQMPRVIRWFWNGEEVTPRREETHGLCISGFVTVPVKPGSGELRLKLEDAGCEGSVRLANISCQSCELVQQQSWSHLYTTTVPREEHLTREIRNAHAHTGVITPFLRTAQGWVQPPDAKEEFSELGKLVHLNSTEAIEDGADNLMVVCTEAGRSHELLWDSDGLPCQSIPLNIGAYRPVGEMTLLCDSLDLDGAIRPMLWHRVDDLSVCGPRDHVFVYDEDAGCILFGDGLHGAIVPAGENAVLVASLQISLCSSGNISSQMLYPVDRPQQSFLCSAASGGRDPETVGQACIRLLKGFSEIRKCATREDYRRLAEKTPGLRVATAVALPMFDSQDPFHPTQKPSVDVVVVPAGEGNCPMPDERFLETVHRYIERYRPICTETRMIPPHYIPIRMQLRLRCDKAVTEDEIMRAVEKWMSCREIGSPVEKNKLELFLQKQPGVWKIDYLEISSEENCCLRGAMGDIILPRNGIACVGQLKIDLW